MVNVKEENVNKDLKCPRCNKIMPLRDYEPVVEPPAREEETMPNTAATAEKTGQQLAGALYVVGAEDIRFQLKEGDNIIGRNGEGTRADIKLDTPNEKKVSREHIIITVEKNSNGGYTHYVKLYKKEINTTYVNKDRIEYGDCLVLKDGHTIELPGITLMFKNS